MKAGKKLFLVFLCSGLIMPSFAETIILESGKRLDGEITEKNGRYIKVNINDSILTYYTEDIESVDGVNLNREIVSGKNFNSSSSDVDIEHIRKILKELGYPKQSWPAIEKELTVFLTKIDFSHLKNESERAKSNPARLRDFVSKLGGLIDQEGCFNSQSPHRLIKLLITSLSDEDVFQVIENSPISLQEKEGLRQLLISCSAVSQLGSIILKALDMNVCVAFSHRHIFNCINLDNHLILFADFFNRVFEMVDLNQYYELEGRYRVLKKEYRLDPKKMQAVVEEWQGGVRRATLKEIFNYLYFYIYIADDYAATPSIYGNFGYAYYRQGNFPRAISYLTKAIEINPNNADSYYNRGNIYSKQRNFFQAVSDYTKAIEINPNYAKAYANRGAAYFLQKEFTKAWKDVQKAEGLGYKVDPVILEEFRKASEGKK